VGTAAFPPSELPGQVQGVIPVTKKIISMGAEFLSLSAPPAFCSCSNVIQHACQPEFKRIYDNAPRRSHDKRKMHGFTFSMAG
jgi:hypothetical protein